MSLQVVNNSIMWFLGQIDNLRLKITEIQSKFKKPHLKRVKISAEAMLSVLLGSKHKESFDFKANLKTVKKEEEKVNQSNVLNLMNAEIKHRLHTCDIIFFISPNRKRRSLTGARMWKPCLAWRAERNYLMLLATKRNTQIWCNMNKNPWHNNNNLFLQNI